MIRLDPLNPQTAKKLAALPYAGWAGEIIRRTVDREWGLGSERVYEVELARGNKECPHCGCTCNSDEFEEYKTVEIFAASKREAENIAANLYPGWESYEADSPRAPKIDVPSDYIAQFDAA